jgi:hypothetical protein
MWAELFLADSNARGAMVGGVNLVGVVFVSFL